uniref:Family with sequence similarity 13 member A n=1 Tax=Rousettus aegyptiacus TaxID=9407 RepID=A0A7J8E6Z4_ROUAE|nr:family with sequence similarity 13 member A [Rousettus aegyptiacus]
MRRAGQEMVHLKRPPLDLSLGLGTARSEIQRYGRIETEPIPTLSSWQQENVNSDEARCSPQAGLLIRQLLDEDSDPMLSPRFYAYGQSRQYLDDTEVPPSPPNSHSFMRYVSLCY